MSWHFDEQLGGAFAEEREQESVKDLSEAILSMYDSPEEKIVRHVRTAEGARRFGQPVGSVILRDRPLAHLTSAESEFDGWAKVTDERGRGFYVGKEDGVWYATDKNSNVVLQGSTEDEVYRELDRYVAPRYVPTSSGALVKGMHPATEDERKRLRIPPAWTDVQIADDPEASLVARGRDVKGRAQSIYSAEHTAGQAEKKFERIKVLATKLDALDARLEKDAFEDDDAAALLIIRRLGMRPGSNRNTGGDVQAFGATNLLAKHATVSPTGRTTFEFVGKKGVPIRIGTNDPAVAEAIRKRRETRQRNMRLFETNEQRVRDYYQGVVGEDFYLKDLRTLHANVVALEEVSKRKRPAATYIEFKKRRKEVATKVSESLGNTPTIALASYINPTVFDAWRKDPTWT